MQAVSDEFKELAKSNARISLAKFVIKDSNTEIDGETIIDGFIEEMTCDNTSLVGNVMAKNLETSIYNNFTNDFIGKEIYAYTGQQLEGGTEEYVSRGTFIIDELEEDVSSGSLKLKGLDYTIKFNKAWEDPLDWENNTYTLGDFAKAVCEFCDLELETEEFSNSDYVLTQQPAFQGYQCRYVMQRIAEIATSNVFISPEDKVQIRLAPQNYVSAEGSSITLEESANSRLKIDEFDGEITQETTILPSGYTQVEYIQSTGSQWIDTGFKVNSNTRVVLDLIDNNNDLGFIFGGRTNSASNNFGFLTISATQFRTDYINTLTSFTRTIGERYIIDKNKNVTRMYSNSTLLNTITQNSGDFNPNQNAYLFAMNDNGNPNSAKAQIKLFSCLIYDNGVIARKFVPCYRNSDNVIGLYDYVNNVFYTNQGTGTFVKGANVTTPTSDYPTPSPDYPQNINVVSGYNEVVAKGYNLLDFSGVSQVSKVTVNSDGSVTLNGAGGFSINFKEIEVKQGVTYSTFVELVSGTITRSPVNGTGLMSPLGKGNFLSNNTQDIYTPNSNVNRHSMWVGDQGTYNNARFRIWAYVGSTPLPYKQYKSKSHEINLGKNIFNSNVLQGTYANNGTIFNSTTQIRTDNYIKIEPSTIYTFSNKNNLVVDRICYYDFNKVFIERSAYINNATFTTTNNCAYIRFTIRESSGAEITPSSLINAQLEKGDKVTSFSPYFEPIFLGKINDYKDFIRRGNGKNLFDKDNANVLNAYIGGANNSINASNDDRTIYISCKPNTTYTISKMLISPVNQNKFRVGTTSETPTIGSISIDYVGYNTGTEVTSITITTSANAKYLCVFILNTKTSITTLEEMLNSIQIEEGLQATEFEPFGFKDKWYLYKPITKLVLNGSENWQNAGANPQKWSLSMSGYRYVAENICVSDYFKSVENGPVGIMTDNQIKFRYHTDKAKWLYICDNRLSATADFKTWLSTHNVTLYYVLANPVITEITSSNYPELYSQLKAIEKARSMDGITYIDVDSVNLPFNLSLQYDQKVSEDIDINSIMSLEVEDTSYKPYNAVTLALADGIEGENVTLRDESSIALYGERPLVITANEFAINQAVREELIEEMFNSINGFNYVPMKLEYNSYDWLERYDRIKVQYDDDKYYETYLFNHTTEFPSTIKSVIEDVAINETKVKYEFVPEEQQKTLHAEVVVDKLNGTVEALASESEDNFSSIRLDIDGIKSEVQSLNVENDELGNEINVLRSSITEQTSTAITDWFNTALKSTIENLENSAESNDQALNEIKSYVRRGVITDPTSPYYNQAFVELGDTTNQTTLRILPNRIQFLTNGQETAFISNNQLYINESTILTKEKVGHWVTTEDENGLLNTYWED